MHGDKERMEKGWKQEREREREREMSLQGRRGYFPPRRNSCSCVPLSCTPEGPSTRISSASTMVLSRWAMMTVVRFSKSLRSADITMCSVVESSDDVAGGDNMRMIDVDREEEIDNINGEIEKKEGGGKALVTE